MSSLRRDSFSHPEPVAGTHRVVPFSGAPMIELKSEATSRLVFLTDPGGLAAERYKLLRRKLCALSPQGGVVLVTSPAPADGKTLTSINLAFSLTEIAHSTCLVDLDFRAPGLFTMLEYHSEHPDMMDVLEGRSGVLEAICQLGARPLYLLGMRSASGLPSLHFDRTRVASVVLRLRAVFEWVILDLAPAIPFSDVPEVLPNVDGALMVLRAGKTKKSLIGPTVEVLGDKLWGVVLNDTVVNGGNYYGHYYGGGNGRARTKKSDECKASRLSPTS
jgi:Mrp family chromosome partitioning ATPase